MRCGLLDSKDGGYDETCVVGLQTWSIGSPGVEVNGSVKTTEIAVICQSRTGHEHDLICRRGS